MRNTSSRMRCRIYTSARRPWRSLGCEGSSREMSKAMLPPSLLAPILLILPLSVSLPIFTMTSLPVSRFSARFSPTCAFILNEERSERVAMWLPADTSAPLLSFMKVTVPLCGAGIYASSRRLRLASSCSRNMLNCSSLTRRPDWRISLSRRSCSWLCSSFRRAVVTAISHWRTFSVVPEPMLSR